MRLAEKLGPSAYAQRRACSLEGCTRRVDHGKPYCARHVGRAPYVRRLVAWAERYHAPITSFDHPKVQALWEIIETKKGGLFTMTELKGAGLTKGDQSAAVEVLIAANMVEALWVARSRVYRGLA